MKTANFRGASTIFGSALFPFLGWPKSRQTTQRAISIVCLGFWCGEAKNTKNKNKMTLHSSKEQDLTLTCMGRASLMLLLSSKMGTALLRRTGGMVALPCRSLASAAPRLVAKETRQEEAGPHSRKQLKLHPKFWETLDDSGGPAHFWAEQARRHITWYQGFHTVQHHDPSQGKVSWFLGGTLNASCRSHSCTCVL